MFDAYKKRLLQNGRYMGEVLKKQSDMIMDQTFTNDIAYRKCFIDGEPVDAKYITYTYYSISKDAVDYHLQFRPGVHYPIGKYVDVPDDVVNYNRWLIVGRSDEPQFVKYNILKCNWTFKWITANDGVVHECLGVLRRKLSYNSGVWRDYYTETVENQSQFIVPTTPETQTIYYNQRFLISDNQINPIAWRVTKIEDLQPEGIIYITLAQDLFDAGRDNKELMIADFYASNIQPSLPQTPPDPIPEYKIKYSLTPIVKVGGSYKTFSISPELSELDSTVEWKVIGLGEEDYTSIFEEANPEKFKIKMSKNYELIEKVFTLELHINGVLMDSIEVEVTGL